MNKSKIRLLSRVCFKTPPYLHRSFLTYEAKRLKLSVASGYASFSADASRHKNEQFDWGTRVFQHTLMIAGGEKKECSCCV